MILLPNMWKGYRSQSDKGLGYNVILARRTLTIHCYDLGAPVSYRVVGQHHHEGSPGSVFRVVEQRPYERQRLMRDESLKLEEYLWPTINFDELTELLGRPPEDW